MGVDKIVGAFGRWRYLHRFQFVEKKGKNISVKCKVCLRDKLLFTVRVSNVSKHLTRSHHHTKLVEQDGHGCSNNIFVIFHTVVWIIEKLCYALNHVHYFAQCYCFKNKVKQTTGACLCKLCPLRFFLCKKEK